MTQTRRLVDTVSHLRAALSVDQPEEKANQVTAIVTPLLDGIRRASDELVGVTRDEASRLAELMTPLEKNAQLQEMASSVLKCAGLARKVIAQAREQRDLAYEASRLDRQTELLEESARSLLRMSYGDVLSYLESHPRLDSIAQSLQNELIGGLLERFYVPNLVEKEGFQLKPRIVSTSIGQIQVDVRAEKDHAVGFQNLERLERKEVLIIETKTTVKADHISELARRRKAILATYHRDSELWEYRLSFETWLVACYGWNDDLVDYAKRNDIVPIDSTELARRLRRHGLLDRSRPPCPQLA